jgi:hypothetical protein
MLAVALAQADQEVGDRRLGDDTQVVDPEAGEVLQIAPQVSPVRRQGVRRQTSLDREVVEVGPNGDIGRDTRLDQDSTSSRETASMPTAAPTGALVNCPA